MKPLNSVQENRSRAPGLEWGLTFMDLVAESRTPVGFNEILKETGVSKATAARLLNILCDRGYLQKDDAHGKYQPGHRMSSSAHNMTEIERIRQEALPVIDSLMESTHNTVTFFYWSGSYIQSLAKRMHPDSLCMQPVGAISTELGACPWGWIFYSSLSASDQESARKWGKVKHITKKRLEQELTAFRQNGFTFQPEQSWIKARRMSAAVYNHENRMVGALAIAGHAFSFPDNKISSFGKKINQHALLLSQKLGYDAVA